MQPTLMIALRAARTAADKVQYTLKQKPTLLAEGMSIESIHKEMLDGASYRAVKDIRSGHPGHNIMVLQTGLNEARKPETDVEWQINLISGEDNFISSFPYFAVSVSQWVKGRVEHAVVINIATGDEFTVSRGRGVALNEKRVRCSGVNKLPQALAATSLTKNTNALSKLSEQNAKLRITGSPLLDFAWLASGALDLVVAEDMEPTDAAVAALLVQESGCLTGNLKGQPFKAGTTELMAANAKLFKAYIQA